MMSLHLDTWKIQIWLSQEQKEILNWNKKTLFLFHNALFKIHKTIKNVADTTFKAFIWTPLKNISLQRYFEVVIIQFAEHKPEKHVSLAGSEKSYITHFNWSKHFCSSYSTKLQQNIYCAYLICSFRFQAGGSRTPAGTKIDFFWQQLMTPSC